MNRLALAIDALEKGHELVILERHGKRPLFRNWPERTPGRDEAGYWDRKDHNYGIKMDGKVGIDRDLHDRKSYDWLRHEGMYFGGVWTVQTRKGRHDVRRLPEDVTGEIRSRLRYAGLAVDFITGRDRFLVGPGSVVDGHVYELHGQITRTCDLPVFPRVDILQEQTRTAVIARVHPPSALTVLDDRTRHWIDRFEPSVQTQGGSRAVFVACLKILSRCGGSVDAAWPLLLYFNATKCSPPWDTEAESGPDSLKRKLREAAKVWTPR